VPKIYIYAKSGHSYGLDNVRRCSAIFNYLKYFEPILTTCDYRAATYAKQYLKVSLGAGVDIIGNLPHMMNRGDILIFDSDEPSKTMIEHIKTFCSLSYEIGVDIPLDIVDEIFLEQKQTLWQYGIFFGDDDYHNELLKLCEQNFTTDMPLIMGHYFFYKNEHKLKQIFKNLIDEEFYQNRVRQTKYLLTASVHTALESLYSGNNPVFYERKDKVVPNKHLINDYKIPTISGDSMREIISNFLTQTK